jgi:2-dehydro-3-deoxyglucarate aldolase/4-hydroxy-2-oxoheptanedioate aldolase
MTDRLRENTLHLGTWLSLGSPVVAELASQCGFDWLLFDLEHGCGSEATLLSNLQATRGAPLARIVRVGAPRPEVILRVLDWGADGIMVPHVSSVDEAEECVRAAHYAPRGRRGFSRSVRAYGYGLRPPSATEPLPRPSILAQIETIEGVEQAQAIASVDGIDVLFVGPADLNFDLKTRPCTHTYDACLTTVADAARKAGKQSGILLRNPDDLPSLQPRGFTWLAVDSDLAILREGFRRIVDRTKQQPKGA